MPPGPLLIGFGGIVVLASLSFWQLQRLDWKEGLIEVAQARMSAAPVPLPASPVPDRDDYLPVTVEGRFTDEREIRFLNSMKPHGPGHDLIVPFETVDGRRILLDRGFVPLTHDAATPPPEGTLRLNGLLRWPDDRNAFTPEPSIERGEWYSRDVPLMAGASKTEPVLVVLQPDDSTGWPRPRPPRVTLPNNHLNYAITWFGLALVWAVMTLFWIRARARKSA